MFVPEMKSIIGLLFLFLINILCIHGWIIPLESLPELVKEGEAMIKENIVQFSYYATHHQPLYEYYNEFHENVQDTIMEIRLLVNQHPLISRPGNVLNRKHWKRNYIKMASRCYHKIEYNAKWIETRQWFIRSRKGGGEERALLMKIRQSLYETGNVIEVLGPLVLEEKERIQELIDKHSNNESIILRMKAFKNMNQNLMLEDALKAAEGIKELIQREYKREKDIQRQKQQENKELAQMLQLQHVLTDINEQVMSH